jgi:3'-5' exoribonuclease
MISDSSSPQRPPDEKQMLTDGIFRIVSIEQSKPGATGSSAKRFPKTRLVLQNSETAGLNAVDWDNALAFKTGQVVKVGGTIKTYRGQPQLSIQNIEPVEDCDPSQLLPRYAGSLVSLESRLTSYIAAIPDVRLSRIAAKLVDPKTELGKNLRIAPASPAAISHEPYIHGLLQHLLEVAETAQLLALKAREFRPLEYGNLNLGFVMFAAILHDIAKTTAYEYGSEGIKFSPAGRLNGHLIESYAVIRDALLEDSSITKAEVDQILHIVASHHGQQSDNPPRTLEATIVHHADYVCSQLGSNFGSPHNKSG